MKDNDRPQKIEDQVVVTLEYTLRVDGEVVDTSEDSEPIQFIQGQQNIIPGLENELYGLEVGDSKSVVISAEQGYGVIDPENYADIPRDQFPEQIPLQLGVELELKDQDGNLIGARIESIDDDSVRLDFNHPLAGKELHFDVTVVDLRDPTSDEISHGHVHNGHEHE